MENQTTWTPPQIGVNGPPTLFATGKPEETEDYPHNFFRCAKWCPDGTQALSHCEDGSLQMLGLHQSDENNTSSLAANPVFRQPAPVLDFTWYPAASTANSALYCFVASVRESPIKLLDANDGRLRASYKIVDHRERQVAPHSMAFNCTATHLYCGYEDAIEVFDFQRPGEGTKIPTTPSKKSKEGMKGIVSSIAFAPDYSGLYAASSLTSAITLYSEESGETPIAYLDGMTYGAAVTQVKFDPVRPYILYAAQRRTNEILCWDVREPLGVLRRFGRPRSKTNQKIMFDIDPAGRWLAIGDENGGVSVFDLSISSSEEDTIPPATRFEAHEDAIGSVAFNPLDASLLTVSGSRHFAPPRSLSSPSRISTRNDLDHNTDFDADAGPDSESTPDSDHDEGESSEEEYIRRPRRPLRPFTKDASAKIWKFPSLTNDPVQEMV